MKKHLQYFFVLFLGLAFLLGCEKRPEKGIITEEEITVIEREIELDIQTQLTTESGFLEMQKNILLFEEGYLAYVVSENDRVKPVQQNIQFIWYDLEGSYQDTESVLVEGLRYFDLIVTADYYLLVFGGKSEVAFVKVDFEGNKGELVQAKIEGDNHDIIAADSYENSVYFVSAVKNKNGIRTKAYVHKITLDGEYEWNTSISQLSFNQKEEYDITNIGIKINNDRVYVWVSCMNPYSFISYAGFVNFDLMGEELASNRIDDVPFPLMPLFVEDGEGDLYVRIVYENVDDPSAYYSIAFMKMEEDMEMQTVARVKDDAAWELVDIEYDKEDMYVVLVSGGMYAYQYQPKKDFVDWYASYGVIVDIIRYEGITYFIEEDDLGNLRVSELKTISSTME